MFSFPNAQNINVNLFSVSVSAKTRKEAEIRFRFGFGNKNLFRSVTSYLNNGRLSNNKLFVNNANILSECFKTENFSHEFFKRILAWWKIVIILRKDKSRHD